MLLYYTTNGKMSYERILNGFAYGDYDVLIGTKMVAKAHDIKILQQLELLLLI